MPADALRTPATVLVLQGGGALGAYQAGAYSVLSRKIADFDWLAGISIGSINAAIIAGAPAADRVKHLEDFWSTVSSGAASLAPVYLGAEEPQLARAAAAMMFGAPGFFTPRLPWPWPNGVGARDALSLYDTGPLVETLNRLVDFDRLNQGRTRLSVGAVNIRTGNFAYFDTATTRIGPEHILASGALPPGLPPIDIEGEDYWDGGLVSNTPLNYVIETEEARDLLVFQLDLFSATGEMPRDLLQADARAKAIRFSSRTRLNTDVAKREQEVKLALGRLLARLPDGFCDEPDLRLLSAHASLRALNIVHLIYRQAGHEAFGGDYEFSRASVNQHWQAGAHDAARALGHPQWEELQAGVINIFDPTNLDPARREKLATPHVAPAPRRAAE
ncbi:MAG: DUF3734 domain-containing protein [Phenylobacterium sp.]|uniref:patatin-like phospholipase family protein n=1 Tax=Phenylobacterium sp. TaxID=1871053 RepID=UPI0027348E03|nr:patatin-like phospholipase family protein [Phenylobacterium sp.]MDP3176093.1 DUF3734 domain-containing protein [Phenylobacterium sp.]